MLVTLCTLLINSLLLIPVNCKYLDVLTTIFLFPHISVINYLHNEDNSGVTWPTIISLARETSVTEYKGTAAEPPGSKTEILNARVLTPRGVVSLMLFSSHLPLLRMYIFVWRILKQNRKFQNWENSQL